MCSHQCVGELMCVRVCVCMCAGLCACGGSCAVESIVSKSNVAKKASHAHCNALLAKTNNNNNSNMVMKVGKNNSDLSFSPLCPRLQVKRGSGQLS